LIELIHVDVEEGFERRAMNVGNFRFWDLPGKIRTKGEGIMTF
jgi:hypothetical protein